MKTAYLAGAITGLNFDQCTYWRQYAIAELAKSNIRGLSPMRCKDYLKQHGILEADYSKYPHYGVLSTSRGVMTRDRFDATRCDVLLVNLLGAKTVSIGTCMEIAWADSKRTPIVCAMEPTGNPHDHMMVQEALGFRVPTLDEAINIVKAILE